MTERVDLFDSTYGHFAEPVLDRIRRETFGDDIGQNSWTTVDELDRFLDRLQLRAGARLLEVACGAGGLCLYAVRRHRCEATGIDANPHGIAAAVAMTAAAGFADRTRFQVADATAPLPFADATFDALLCIDSINHLPDRLAVLREWRRVLRPGARALFTDPVVITGPVTNDELARRSSIGRFVFVPPEATASMLEQAGLTLLAQIDVTANAAATSGRWHEARARHRDELLRIEGEQRFLGLQRFFATVHALTSERRLSRYAFLVERRG